MSIWSAYRKMPVYLAVPQALLTSAVMALTIAGLGAYALVFILGKLHGPGGLDDGILAFFFAAPGIAILAFVISFSILINCHRAATWPTPTFAFVLGAILVWVWARGFGGIGFAWYAPATVAWLLSCWLLHRNPNARPKHVIEA